MLTQKPYIGQPCTVRGIECVIVAIESYGTITVEAVDGSCAFRVSGLSWEV